jgi:16S rRNA (guanine966-N2)-methyltransferase
MRITSGLWKGYPLQYPTDRRLRPTQEKVRSGIFNSLQSQLEGARVLDLFCGTGSVAYEALSRGAGFVTLVDLELRYAALNRDDSIVRTPEELKDEMRSKIQLVRSSVRDFLKHPRSEFDMVFMDPPWDRPKLYPETLGQLVESGILRPAVLLVCEHPRRIKLTIPPELELVQVYSYSDTIVTVMRDASNLSR